MKIKLLNSQGTGVPWVTLLSVCLLLIGIKAADTNSIFKWKTSPPKVGIMYRCYTIPPSNKPIVEVSTNGGPWFTYCTCEK